MTHHNVAGKCNHTYSPLNDSFLVNLAQLKTNLQKDFNANEIIKNFYYKNIAEKKNK